MWCEIVPLVENPKPYFCTIKSRSIYVILLHTLTVGCLYRVSHELRSLLRESVPYVKIYRYIYIYFLNKAFTVLYEITI